MKIIILGTPQPKQSARFKSMKAKGGKTYVMSYQKKSVVDNAENIGHTALSQLPAGFKPYESAIGVKVLFVFPPLTSWSKTQKAIFESGLVTIYKSTRPDSDNLEKCLWDGLNGIVFKDDSLVCKKEVAKIYGKEPRTEIEFYKL